MRRRINWTRGPVELSGDPAVERRLKGWLLVEEKDIDDETTLVKALSPVMNWFVKPATKGGHGGPMIDSHSNAVVGNWDKWGVGIEPETKQLAMWVEGPVHRGPEEENFEFPAADLVWADVKSNNVSGLSWGGNKRRGFLEFDDATGEVFGNTITGLIPYEISIVREGARINGMPAMAAVPHATLISHAEAAKAAGAVSAEIEEILQEHKELYDNPKAEEVDEAPSDQWINNCSERCGWLGGSAKTFCRLLYIKGSDAVKEAFGAPRQAVEIEDEIIKSRSRGTSIPHDAKTAVRESPLAARYLGLRLLDLGSEEKALSDLQRVLDGKSPEGEVIEMNDEHAKELTAALEKNTAELKAAKTAPAAPVPEPAAPPVPPVEKPKDDPVLSELKAISGRLETVEGDLKAIKETKGKKEDEDEPPKKPKPDDEEEEGKKKEKKTGADDPDLSSLTTEQKAAYDQAIATLEEKAVEEKKAFFKKIQRTKATPPAGNRPGLAIPPSAEEEDDGIPKKEDGTPYSPWELSRMKPEQRRALGV